MNFNIYNSIILAGVIQGIIFGLVWLFSKKYRARSTHYLVALILVYSLSNLQFYLLDIGVFEYSKFYDIYYIPFALLMPPLMLFYGLTLMNEDRKRRTDGLLFLPFGIVILLAIFYKYQLLVEGKPSGYNKLLDSIPSWAEYLAIVFSFIVVSYLFLKVHGRIVKTKFSIKEVAPRFQWFRTFMIFQFFTIIVWTYSEIKFASSDENYYYYPLWILVAIIIYWMGHVGIYKYGINEERKKIRRKVLHRYSISEVSSQKNEHIDALEKFVHQKAQFLDPNISLESVASELELSTGHLSKIINTELGVSFKEYVNNLRVEEAKNYLLDPDFSKYTLVAIGLEAGFNSKSAFNASFKKITGLTPSQFKEQTSN